MNGNKEIIARFDSVTYTLALTKSGDGDGQVRVNGTLRTLPFQEAFNSGQIISLESVPGLHCKFSGWSGDLTGNANPDTIIMNVDKSITIYFDSIISTIELRAINFQEKYILQSYPNPFDHFTQISFSLAAPSRISLLIYNQFSTLIYRLIDEVDLDEGSFAIVWKGENYYGNSLSSGVYFAVINVTPKTNDKQYFSKTIKLLITR